MAGHQYGLFASQVAVKDSLELKRFAELYKRRCWKELSLIKEFDGAKNAAIIYSLFCPDGACILVVRDPFELYDSDELLDLTDIDADEALEIRSMQPELYDL